MGQYWQSALKIRVIMIPLPENTAAGAASGDSCGEKGGCKVFRQPLPGGPCIFRPTPGERKSENHGRGSTRLTLSDVLFCCGVWELFIYGKRILDTDFRESRIDYTHKFTVL